jgi:hypothetical protein
MNKQAAGTLSGGVFGPLQDVSGWAMPSGNYPWQKTDEATKALQRDINAAIGMNNSIPSPKPYITEDGWMGAQTCGAAKFVYDGNAPSTCQGFQAFPPSTVKPAVIPVAPVPVKPEVPTEPSASLGAGDNSMLWIGAGVVAVGLVALPFLLLKKRRR